MGTKWMLIIMKCKNLELRVHSGEETCRSITAAPKKGFLTSQIRSSVADIHFCQQIEIPEKINMSKEI